MPRFTADMVRMTWSPDPVVRNSFGRLNTKIVLPITNNAKQSKPLGLIPILDLLVNEPLKKQRVFVSLQLTSTTESVEIHVNLCEVFYAVRTAIPCGSTLTCIFLRFASKTSVFCLAPLLLMTTSFLLPG